MVRLTRQSYAWLRGGSPEVHAAADAGWWARTPVGIAVKLRCRASLSTAGGASKHGRWHKWTSPIRGVNLF